MRSTKSLLSRFLRFFFEILYTDLSWVYDAVAWLSSIGQWRAWQRTSLEVLPPGDILEIGFGTGHMLKEVTSANRLTVGVDVSKKMAKIARKRLTKANLPAYIARATSYNLPFPDARFSSVLSTFPSDYIYTRETLNEIHRVLKHEGKMVIVPGVNEITGPKPGGNVFIRILDGIAAWLYAFTGEASNPGTDWREKLTIELDSIGFSTVIESVILDRAVVIRVVAQKNFPPS
jgi:SAM-dependent methyltransferase